MNNARVFTETLCVYTDTFTNISTHVSYRTILYCQRMYTRCLNVYIYTYHVCDKIDLEHHWRSRATATSPVAMWRAWPALPGAMRRALRCWHRCQAMVLHGEVVICNFFNDRWPAIVFGWWFGCSLQCLPSWWMIDGGWRMLKNQMRQGWGSRVKPPFPGTLRHQDDGRPLE